ncbi:BamA/TamA family outer membrane protein [Maribacter sp. 2307ULW6-5]|uniref:translocation and assembly module lipoprotein TamL n=1 Tax=Maribacter sp. 2307ULW6-5 TaxID=3386275 RepID=UPI0039BCE7D4
MNSNRAHAPWWIWPCILCALLQSCGVAKYVPGDQVLYTGGELSLNTTAPVKDRAELENELRSLLRPAPNSKFLGTRLGLYFHYRAQRKHPGFITKWLNKKVGQEPVYLSDVDPQRVREVLLNRLDNRGFFNSNVAVKMDSSARFVGIDYEIDLPQSYQVETYRLEGDSLPVVKAIADIMAQSAIEKGDRFDLQLLKYERERIDNALKQRGYYNFNPDFLIFEADTNAYQNKGFDLFLRLKRQVPQRALIPYEVDSIQVFPNYAVQDSAKTNQRTTVNGMDFFQDEVFFDPKKLSPYILMEEGQPYSAKKAALTSNRLSALGSYKFVNIQFKELDTTLAQGKSGKLLSSIYLSPLTKRSLRAELQLITKSNGFTGPGLGLTYTNRNLFRGGEVLSLSGNVSYATQLSPGDNSGLATIASGLKADLVFPRLVPFSPDRFRYAVPKTKISLGGDLLRRSDLYSLYSLNTSFGYTWQANRFVYHELNPLNVSYVNLADTSPEFDDLLENNPFLDSSFEQQFIAGLNYTFTYSELVDEDKDRPFFFSGSLDIAGNTLNLFSGNSTVLGLEYAQYARGDLDVRYYFKGRGEKTLVTRVYAGLGIPYGNSNNLPFVKQFFSGGPYSVRAFRIRALGPGSFDPATASANTFFDQSGNLQLEANVEYRFPIWSYLKGAVFADAGNVWLTDAVGLDDDSAGTGNALRDALNTQGRFGPDWYRELGIGVGFGLRVDIQNFVIRLDLASPVHVPYLPEDNRWMLPFSNTVDDDFMLNFAIGYPF